MIKINRRLSIPENEINFTFTRSGGPGGQNVNKVSTRATLWFDIAGSPSLNGEQKGKLRHRLGNRVSREGVLQIVSARHRTQKANREDAIQRFAALLAGALLEKPRRRKTRPPRAAKEARLKAKKRHGRQKATRSWKPGPEHE